jgi:hypothetical protein
MKIADRFAEQCSVVYDNNNDTCGSITRADIAYLTPAQLESLFTVGGLWAEMDAWFKTAIEMKACGVKRNSLYDWIMSSSRRDKSVMLQTIKKSPSVSLLQPFILGRQASIINTDYWAISTGGAQSGYTAGVTGPLTSGDLAEGVAGDRWIRVISPDGLDLDDKWFNPGTRIYIWSRTNGVAEQGNWEVLARATATDQTYIDVLVTSLNAGSSAAYDATPLAGVVVAGVNNVNDYEKWCYNMPNWNPDKLVPFWIQTFRRTRCVDSEYIKFYNRLRTEGANDAFKRFGDMDLAQRNAQDEREHQKRFVNHFFYAKPLNASQTITGWQSLPDITTPTGFSVDPGTGGKLIAKRAENVGVLEQLRRCNRVFDLLGHQLNFYEWLDENYRIMRARETNGKKVTDIDWFTDSVTAANLMTAFLQYWKQESLEQLQLTMEIGKVNTLGMKYNSFMAKFPAGVRINIVTDPYFDDWRNANKGQGQEGAGMLLLALDLGRGGSIYWAQIASARKSYTVGDVDDLAKIDKDWACVMKSVTRELTLVSDTGTVIVECPQENAWIMNFADAVPIMTGKTASETNMY